MKKTLSLSLFMSILFLFSCKKEEKAGLVEETKTIEIDSAQVQETETASELNQDSLAYWKSIELLSDTALVDLKKLHPAFILDVKYATTDNFTKQVLYECEKCLLRKKPALALIEAAKFFEGEGYKVKLFDTYRPNFIQWKMWEIVSDPRYVADPAKGSMHNRGAAVDLSLTDTEGNELEMGSPYDFFGQVSHHAYQDLPKEVLERRIYLKESLAKFGFDPITSEWWHYSYRDGHYNILNESFECE
ncbi:M15 family metallopeptidase [Flammeovirgaceae bacterium SG7u.111]|nr:M15 family metallopeptidase [Flammeovirgaceae bacterium SG7u.132]WPO35221.1 M15 family metallopeptidase [Flammeovirgaceae bacterium SG7u.111]